MEPHIPPLHNIPTPLSFAGRQKLIMGTLKYAVSCRAIASEALHDRVMAKFRLGLGLHARFRPKAVPCHATVMM